MGKPVIIYRLGSLGDTIVALPCFHKIEEVFHDRPRIALTNKPIGSNAAPLAAVLGSSGLISGAIDYPVGLRAPKDIIEVARNIRKTKADTLIYLAAPRGRASLARDLLFFRVCGFRRIIGAPFSSDLSHWREDAVAHECEPEAERLARSLSPLGAIDLDDRSNWDLRLSPEELAAGEAALSPFEQRPFVTFNLGGKVARNNWGDANWAELIAGLSACFPGHGLAAVGAAADVERSDVALRLWPGPIANLCGRLTPRQSAAALRRARVFVGHDSGPMHLAAAVGTPTVGMFGDNYRPRIWHPYGPGHQAIHHMGGMEMIQVGQVRRAVLQAAGVCP